MRMRFAPEASQELYDAMDAEDWDLAHKIAVKYNFAIRTEATKYNKNKHVYYARYYDGEIKQYETIEELSEALGGSFDAVRLRLARHSGTYWTKGKMKGYVVWQEKAGLSDQPLRIPKPMQQPPVTTKRKKYTYFLKDTEGKVSEYGSSNALGKVLGRDRGSLYHYLKDTPHTWRQGELKGMSIWRKEV